MSLTSYNGIALGGPLAGQMIEHTRPVYPVAAHNIKLIGVTPINKSEYYYVPLMGYQGFFIHESETKGTGPWDDILRILSESYVAEQARRRDTSDSSGSADV